MAAGLRAWESFWRLTNTEERREIRSPLFRY